MATQLGQYSDVSAVCVPFVFAQLCKELTAVEVEKATIVNLYRDISGGGVAKIAWPITGDDFVRSFYPRQGNFALSCEALQTGDCVRTIDLSFNSSNHSCADITAAMINGHTFWQYDGNFAHGFNPAGPQGVIIDVSVCGGVVLDSSVHGVVTFQMKNCNMVFVKEGPRFAQINHGAPGFPPGPYIGFVPDGLHGAIISDTITSAVDLALLSTWHYLSNWVYAPGQGAGFDDGDGGVFDTSFNLVGFALGQWADDLNVPSDCWTPCSVLRITEELLKANYICNLKCDVCCSLCSFELAQALNSLSNATTTWDQYQGRTAQAPVVTGDRLQLSILFTNSNMGTNPIDLRMNFQIASNVTQNPYC